MGVKFLLNSQVSQWITRTKQHRNQPTNAKQ